MWISISGLLAILVMLEIQSTAAAPSSDWQERLIDKEYAAELYNILQNHYGQVGGIPRMTAAKRNSEIINSLLALPKSMADVGR